MAEDDAIGELYPPARGDGVREVLQLPVNDLHGELLVAITLAIIEHQKPFCERCFPGQASRTTFLKLHVTIRQVAGPGVPGRIGGISTRLPPQSLFRPPLTARWAWRHEKGTLE